MDSTSPFPELIAINLPKYRILFLFIQNFFDILQWREICFPKVEIIHEAKGIFSRTDSLLSLFPRWISSLTDTALNKPPLPPPLPLLSKSFK